MEGMNQFRIQYIYTWKCHNEIFCIGSIFACLNKQKGLTFFSKTEDKNITQVLSLGWYQWEEGGNKESEK
jgi:hypothetical protein